MTKQVIEYTDLVELFLVLFLLMFFVFFGFLFYFYKKYTQKIKLLDKKPLEYQENLLSRINILIEQNNNFLTIFNSETAKNQEFILDLKLKNNTIHEHLIANNKIINQNFRDLVAEFITLEKLEKENYKLLHIINRKTNNKPKLDNVQ